MSQYELTSSIKNIRKLTIFFNKFLEQVLFLILRHLVEYLFDVSASAAHYTHGDKQVIVQEPAC